MKSAKKPMVSLACLSAVVAGCLCCADGIAEPSSHAEELFMAAKPVIYNIIGRPKEQPWIGWRLPVVMKQSVRGRDQAPGAIRLSYGGGLMGAECLFALWSLSVCDLENYQGVFAGQADAAISVSDLSTWQIINKPGALISSLGQPAPADQQDHQDHQDSTRTVAKVAVRIEEGVGLASLVNEGEISTVLSPDADKSAGPGNGNPYLGTAIEVGKRSTSSWYAGHIPAFTLDNRGGVYGGVALDFGSQESLRVINSGTIRGDILLPELHGDSELILHGSAVLHGRIVNLQRMAIDNTEDRALLASGEEGPAVVTPVRALCFFPPAWVTRRGGLWLHCTDGGGQNRPSRFRSGLWFRTPI